MYTHHARFFRHGLLGERAQALVYATRELALEANYDLPSSLRAARCCSLVGEQEKALDSLQHAIRMGMINHPFLSRFDLFLEPLRGEPRFAALMQEAKQRMDQLSV